jgi:lysophospholipase L1-like esterase
MLNSQRLVAFGCSNTYGHGLPDCHMPPNEHGPTYSKQAWPSLLANDLNLDLHNQGVPGASNLEILHNILHYDFKKDDIVVVMWSYVGRDMLFGKKNILGWQDIIRIGLWQTTDLSKSWRETHSREDVATRSWYYIHHATLFLASKGIKFYNVFSGIDELIKFKPDFINKDVYHDIKIISSRPYDLALDNVHPGPKTHRMIADKIRKIINED